MFARFTSSGARRRVRSSSRDAVSVSNQYPAVSIRTYRNGCPAAEALRGKRFLPADAPPLPLPNCIWARCNCTYAHHVDRRTGNRDRRRMLAETGEYPLSIGEDDQRETRGRRLRDSDITPKD